MYTPSLCGNAYACGSVSFASPMIFNPSLNHCTAEPATKTDPSSAYVTCSPICQATVDNNPSLDFEMSCPVFISKKQPVPYVFFTSPC